MLAPAAYQDGPLMPYLYATVDDSKSVAAQIQADITDDAKGPLLILLPAVENHRCFSCSEPLGIHKNEQQYNNSHYQVTPYEDQIACFFREDE